MLDTSDYEEDARRASVRVREYINPAVYVEKTYDSSPCGGRCDYIPGSGDHPKTVKRCVCFTSPNECPCHPVLTLADSTDAEADESGVVLSAVTSPQWESESGVTIKASDSTTCCEDLRLSIVSSMSNLSTVRPNINNDPSRDEHFRQWCLKKDLERKVHEQREALVSRVKERQRKAQLQLERENFRRWLALKKKDELEKRRQMEEVETQERAKREEQERRAAENEENFQNWLKKKEEQLLEKKTREQMEFFRMELQRKQRLEYSERAYQLWLQQSKNKQKPLPFGRGLETLKSSASVAYINPVPWVPNIDKKPNSQ